MKAKYSSEMPGNELLRGVEAQDAFVALFDDFDNMAREAVNEAARNRRPGPRPAARPANPQVAGRHSARHLFGARVA